MINIKESSTFSATLVALVGVGAYMTISAFPILKWPLSMLPQSKYYEGLLVAIPMYFAQLLSNSVIEAL
jgi:hypothetical protein